MHSLNIFTFILYREFQLFNYKLCPQMSIGLFPSYTAPTHTLHKFFILFCQFQTFSWRQLQVLYLHIRGSVLCKPLSLKPQMFKFMTNFIRKWILFGSWIYVLLVSCFTVSHFNVHLKWLKWKVSAVLVWSMNLLL